VALLLARRAAGYVAPFRLVDLRVLVGVRGGESFAEATIKLAIGGAVVHTAAEGVGPVSALDGALRKGQTRFEVETFAGAPGALHFV
jgi:2-isopropylmalate synthase